MLYMPNNIINIIITKTIKDNTDTVKKKPNSLERTKIKMRKKIDNRIEQSKQKK